jgi:protein TonB
MVSPPPPPPVSNSNSSKSGSGNSAPISGGLLNSRATRLPQPTYPAAARAVKASGTVVVQVTVDENGNVISAKAISGHPLLQSSAAAAALKARFTPTLVGGKYVKVNGTITYEFSAQ